MSDYVGIGIEVFLEFSTEAFPDVLQTNGVGILPKIWGVSFGGRPSNGYIVFEFGHEYVDEVGTGLF